MKKKDKYKQSKLGEWLADQEGHSASEYGDIEDLVKEPPILSMKRTKDEDLISEPFIPRPYMIGHSEPTICGRSITDLINKLDDCETELKELKDSFLSQKAFFIAEINRLEGAINVLKERK